MTTRTDGGTAARRSSSSSVRTTVPVGLFGVQTMSTRVRSVTAAAIAGRSCRWPGASGTGTEAAPATAQTMG